MRAHATTAPAHAGTRDALAGLSAAFAVPYRILTTLRLWQARSAYRAKLMSLDVHRLADIGLTRAEALREMQKPFWVA